MTLRNALEKPVIERRPSLTARSGPRVRLGATTLSELLAPDGVDRRWNHMVQVGDSYITTLELRGAVESGQKRLAKVRERSAGKAKSAEA